MPYKSNKQRKFFEMCRNSGAASKVCPPQKVLDEFHKETYHPEKRRDVSLQRSRKVNFH